jgi:membrane protein YdbS with pleckstrin-like domain
MIDATIALGPDEEIVHVIRRHWFSLLLVALFDGIVFILGIIAIGALDGFLISSEVMAIDPARAVFVSAYLIALMGLLLWMHFFAVWSDHWLDAWIVTNKRFIDIEQKGFFNRQVSSFPLERIQDVSYETHGILAMWLHFGDVRIQTASISSDFIMRQVPNPDFAKEQIMQALAQKETPMAHTPMQER